MNVTKEELNEILDSYKWIKVKKYEVDENLPAEEKYQLLEKHHKEETEFLIRKTRELARKILQDKCEHKNTYVRQEGMTGTLGTVVCLDCKYERDWDAY